MKETLNLLHEHLLNKNDEFVKKIYIYISNIKDFIKNI